MAAGNLFGVDVGPASGSSGSPSEKGKPSRKDHRGLTRFRVRGLGRVQSVLMLSVLTYNLLRAIAIAPEVMLPSTA